jgi:hypothetical protein
MNITIAYHPYKENQKKTEQNGTEIKAGFQSEWSLKPTKINSYKFDTPKN